MGRMSNAVIVEKWLRGFLSEHGGVAGSVHVRSGTGLALCTAVNLPPPVVEAVRSVPAGKGMAGLALERRRPVSTCNLKTDDSGDVRPGAKAVDANAAIALPVFDAEESVRAVVGIAFMGERTISEDEMSRLAAAAATLPE
jgi:L-methionine (R)-S-oxide reductase